MASLSRLESELYGKSTYSMFRVKVDTPCNHEMVLGEASFNGTSTFNSTTYATISRSGHFLKGMILETTLPSLTLTTAANLPNATKVFGGWIPHPGEALLAKIELRSGTQVLDTFYSEPLHLRNQLTIVEAERQAYNEQIGNVPINVLQVSGAGTGAATMSITVPSYTVRVPLPFWCNNTFEQAWPLFLTATEIVVSVTYERLSSLCYMHSINEDGVISEINFTITPADLSNTRLWVEYYNIYDKRILDMYRVGTLSYFIDTLEIASDNKGAGTQRSSTNLSLRRTSKAMFWVVQPASYSTRPINRFNYTTHPFSLPPLSGVREYSLDNQYIEAAIAALSTSGANRSLEALYTNLGNLNTNVGNLADRLASMYFRPIGKNTVATASFLVGSSPKINERAGFYFNRSLPRQYLSITPDVGVNILPFSLRPFYSIVSTGSFAFGNYDQTVLAMTFEPQEYVGTAEEATNYPAHPARDIRIYSIGIQKLSFDNGAPRLEY